MLSNSGSSSHSHYDAQLAPAEHTRELDDPTRSSVMQWVGQQEVWLALLFLVLTSWGAWNAFSWLMTRWQIF